MTGKRAPDWTLKDISGKQFQLSKLKGKPVVIDFFATWCGPCREEMPTIEKLWKEFKGKGVQFVAISDESQDILKSFAQQYSLTFPVLSSAGTKVFDEYGVMAVPRLVFIDRQGVIREDFEGTQDEATIRAALAKIGVK